MTHSSLRALRVDERSLQKNKPQNNKPVGRGGSWRVCCGVGGFVLSRAKVQLQENKQGTRLEELNHWVTSRVTVEMMKSPPATMSRIIRYFMSVNYWRGSFVALFVNQGPWLTTRWLPFSTVGADEVNNR